MKLGEVVNAMEPLQRLAGTDMKLQYAYQIHKVIRRIQQEFDFFHEKRQAIFEKYGTYTKSDLIEIPKENQEVAGKELDELLAMEVLTEYTKPELPISHIIVLTARASVSIGPKIVPKTLTAAVPVLYRVIILHSGLPGAAKPGTS